MKQLSALSGYIIGGIAGFLIAALLFSIIGFGQGGTNISTNAKHSEIAKGFTCQDLTFNTALTLHHLQTGAITFMPNGALPQNAFPNQLKTTQSVWTFTSGDDVDAFMVIYGPGNDGVSYLITFGKVTPNAMEISGWNRTVSWSISSGQTVVIKP